MKSKRDNKVKEIQQVRKRYQAEFVPEASWKISIGPGSARSSQYEPDWTRFVAILKDNNSQEFTRQGCDKLLEKQRSY